MALQHVGELLSINTECIIEVDDHKAYLQPHCRLKKHRELKLLVLVVCSHNLTLRLIHVMCYTSEHESQN